VDFCSVYPHLEPAQQDRFRHIITRLLSGHIITPGTALQPDADWRFAERFRELLDSYLRIGGWRLDFDPSLRLCRVVHEGGEQRVRFSKLESLVLCTLRLHYHEHMQKVSESEICDLSVGELRERLIQSGVTAQKVSRRVLADALRRLTRHSLIVIDRPFTGEDHEKLQIHALIEKVLPPDKLTELADRVRLYAAAPSTPASDDAESEASDESAEQETV
jgi:hypothetical protein